MPIARNFARVSNHSHNCVVSGPTQRTCDPNFAKKVDKLRQRYRPIVGGIILIALAFGRLGTHTKAR